MGMTEGDVAALRARVAAYGLDDPADTTPFSARLRKATGWTAAKTRRVMAEYLRFAVLATCSDAPVSPSKSVDEAWHLHLTDTRRYWEDFCPRVLGRPLHHDPGRGGAEEGARLAAQYRATLELYEQVFRVAPPADIWPRRSQAPQWPRAIRPAVLVLPLASAGCAAVINSASPGAIQGPQFIIGYGLLCVAALFIMSWLQSLAARGGKAVPAGLTTYELAYLAGGGPRVYAAALTRLYRGGQLVLSPPPVTTKGKGRRGRSELVPGAPLPADAQPLDEAIVEAARAGRLARARAFPAPIAAIKARLQALGLWADAAAARRVWWIWLAVIAPVGGLGLARLWFGVHGRRAVGFLILALILTSVFSLAMTASRAATRTAAGRKALARARAERREARRVLPSDPTPDLGLALFGLAALSTAEMGDFLSTARRYGVGVDGSSDGGGGSSCGGGGGCGGGCGG